MKDEQKRTMQRPKLKKKDLRMETCSKLAMSNWILFGVMETKKAWVYSDLAKWTASCIYVVVKFCPWCQFLFSFV